MVRLSFVNGPHEKAAADAPSDAIAAAARLPAPATLEKAATARKRRRDPSIGLL
jgi:hypothetical protein